MLSLNTNIDVDKHNYITNNGSIMNKISNG